ncbi:hypothetical protein JCM3765_005318 [Sporobolomyces pararoseus]
MPPVASTSRLVIPPSPSPPPRRDSASPPPNPEPPKQQPSHATDSPAAEEEEEEEIEIDPEDGEVLQALADAIPSGDDHLPHGSSLEGFETPEIASLVQEKLLQLVQLKREHVKQPGVKAQMDQDWKEIESDFYAEIKAAAATLGKDIRILTKPKGNPIAAPILVRLFFPPDRTKEEKGWLDFSISTLDILRKTGLTALYESGDLDYIDLHPCNQHSSSTKDPTFPKPTSAGNVKWDEVGCSTELNEACEKLNARVEEKRQEYGFGLGIQMGKGSVNKWISKLRKTENLPPSTQVERYVPIPPDFNDTGISPEATPYTFSTSASASTQMQSLVQNSDSLQPLSHPSDPLERPPLSTTITDSTYISIDVCHPSYSAYASTDSNQVLASTAAFDTIVIEVGDLLSPQSNLSSYNFLTTRIFRYRLRKAGGFTVPPSVKIALGLRKREEEMMESGARPEGLLEDDLPERWRERIVQGADEWESYGLKGIGTSKNPRTIIERAIAAWKASVQQANRKYRWGVLLDPGAALPSIAMTSDLRFPSADGAAGSIAHAQDVLNAQRLGIPILDGSTFSSIYCTSDLRFPSVKPQQSSIRTLIRDRGEARAGFTDAFSLPSDLPSLPMTSDLRFPALPLDSYQTCIRNARQPVQGVSDNSSSLPSIGMTSDLRFPALDHLQALNRSHHLQQGALRGGIALSEASSGGGGGGPSFPAIAMTSDLRFPSVDGEANINAAMQDARNAQRAGITSKPKTSLPSITMTSDLRFPAIDGSKLSARSMASAREDLRAALLPDEKDPSPLISIAMTSDLRFPSVAGTVFTGMQAARSTARKREGIPADFSTSDFSTIAMTSDLRFPSVDGSGGKWMRQQVKKRQTQEQGDPKPSKKQKK